MPEAIRDVLIRIALELDDGKFQPPDLEAIEAPIVRMVDSTGDLKQSLHEVAKEAETAFQVPGADQLDDDLKAATAEAMKLGQEIDDLKNPIQQAANEMEAARQKIHDNSLRAAESFKTAGDGAFTLARGIAFVGTSSEENFQRMIQTVAKVQGAFDIFKGGVDTIKGLVEGTRALRASTTAAAVAETGLAGANTAVAATGTAATGAMGGLVAALGPIALAGAAVGAAFLFFKSAPDDIEDTADALGEIPVKAKESEKALREVKSILQDPLFRLRKEQDVFPFAEQFEEVRQEAQGLADDVFDSFAGVKLPTSVKIALNKEFKEAITGGIDTAGVTDILGGLTNLGKDDRALLFFKDNVDLLDQAKQLADDRLSILTGQRAEMTAMLDLAKQDLEIARDRVTAEENKLLTLKERLGSLSPERAQELKLAAEQVRAGGIVSVTLQQAELLSLLGKQGQDILSQKRLQRFQDLGLADLAKDFDLGAGLADAKKKLEEAESELGGPGGLIETLTQSRDEATGNIKSLVSAMKGFLQVQADVKRDVEAIKQELQSGTL